MIVVIKTTKHRRTRLDSKNKNMLILIKMKVMGKDLNKSVMRTWI